MTKEKKGFLHTTYIGFALKNIAIAVLIVVCLGLLTLFMTNILTRHGKNEIVPDVKGIELNEAIAMLERHNLKVEIIDSTYVKGKPLGTVLEQNPIPESKVKPKRTVYLIINSTAVRKLPAPNLQDLSLRQGEAMLESMGMKVAKIEYAPSEYRDLILEVKYQGRKLEPGTKIPEGSALVIVAGNGGGTGIMSSVPTVIGLNMETAINVITSSSFLLGNITYDEQPNGDEDQYVVYHQFPTVTDSVSSGIPIDLWLSKNPNKTFTLPARNNGSKSVNTHKREEKKEKVEDIEEFF